jgi:hypothetical protein
MPTTWSQRSKGKPGVRRFEGDGVSRDAMDAEICMCHNIPRRATTLTESEAIVSIRLSLPFPRPQFRDLYIVDLMPSSPPSPSFESGRNDDW